MPPTEKTQAVRLVDVFLLAPFMVYAAYQIRPELELTRLALAGAGVATALYNGQNYLANAGRIAPLPGGGAPPQ